MFLSYFGTFLSSSVKIYSRDITPALIFSYKLSTAAATTRELSRADFVACVCVCVCVCVFFRSHTASLLTHVLVCHIGRKLSFAHMCARARVLLQHCPYAHKATL